ncbi:LRR 8 domain containing protein, partial [Asbolus verrucosus]
VPVLSTTNLLTLSLAYNSLPTVSPEIAGNLSSLRNLNLNYNDLSVVPIVTHSLTKLRYLSLVANPITALTNTSLLGVASELEELDLRKIDLTVLETGAFCKMQSLRTLKINLCSNVKNFNIPRILQYTDGLKSLEIHVSFTCTKENRIHLSFQIEKDTENLANEMMGELPAKLYNLTFTGKGLKKLSRTIFQVNCVWLFFTFSCSQFSFRVFVIHHFIYVSVTRA